MATDVEAEIDRLYQLPLGEFTGARNALAKTAGARAAEIKAFEKPSAAAWAVNQVYWRQRKLYDRLVTAAERLRATHAKRIGGHEADTVAAETAHRAAVTNAADAARDLLRQTGDAATPATLIAVSETLGALPGSERPGRLTRPLRPQGFEALAGLLAGAAAAPARRAEITPFPTKAAREKSGETEAAKKRREAADAEREAAARAREASRVEEELKKARATERDAEAALERATKDLAAAEREHARLTKALEDAGDAMIALGKDLNRRQREADQAAIARARIEHELARLR